MYIYIYTHIYTCTYRDTHGQDEVVLEQLNIATVATVGFAESGVPAGCLRPFA